MLEDFTLDAEVFDNRLIKWQLVTLRVMGFIFARTDSFKLFNFIRGIIVALSILLLVCSHFRSISLNLHDLEWIIPGLATSITYTNILARIIAFYCYRKKYINLLTNLQIGVNKILQASFPEEIKMYTSYGEYVNKIVSTILLPLSIAIVLIFMEGAYFIMFQSDGWTIRQQAGNSSKGLNHLFVLFPTGSLNESFLFTFVMPYYLAVVGFSCFFAWHTFNTALMRYISFRLDVVKYRLENMPEYVDSFLKNSQPVENQESGQHEATQQRPELFKNVLVNCVEDIVEIKFFTSEYEYVSRITLFLESSTISGLLCMQLYLISKDFFSGYGIYQFWCVATIGLLWLYYWHGNEISQKSNEITNALYFFNWYEVPLSLQKDIAIFMAAAMRPIIIKSGFINMNVNTFFMILKTSYSYFTLLQNFVK